MMLLGWYTGEAGVETCAKVSNQEQNDGLQEPSLFSAEETCTLLQSLERATSRSDVGADLVARLLNDRRSNFKSLLAIRGTCQVPLADDELFTVDIIRNGYPRASNVADGVKNFFIKMMVKLEEEGCCEETFAKMSKQNGALHYRLKARELVAC
ncbi:hypothetical protein Tcan_14441 [Toxocara canis]|uniref:Uncharacterized protein n=1 Tax=Toxocara canis TaxID=6265 RepID=A0A0B2VF86_TOXCA|nr:hypothetical protein Tcan_14441 [Toxocara canis]